jgi:hypothetical protein
MKKIRTNREILVIAMGEKIVGSMEVILAAPDDMRLQIKASQEIKTVDGHVWTVKLEYHKHPARLTRKGLAALNALEKKP